MYLDELKKIRKLGEYWRNYANGTPNWSNDLL